MSQQQNTNALMQQLTTRFGLVSDPFSGASGYFFGGAQRQHNLESLRHLACFGDMVLFLTGDKGAGKTLLLHKMVESSFEGLNVIYLDCERLVQEAQGQSNYIITTCMKLLGVEQRKGNQVELLGSLLASCHRLVAEEGSRTLFLFDNADKMPKKELLAYCGFCKKMPPESAMVMLFAGPGSLLQSIKQGNNLDQDAWWHQIQLKPFSKSDVLPYLEQALVLAGYSGKLELTDVQIQHLVDLGKGLPGRINKLCPSVILEPGLLKIKSKAKSRGMPVGIMFGLAALLSASFVFVSYQHGLFDRLVPVFSLDDETGENAGDLVVSEQKIDLKSQDESSRLQLARLEMLDGVMKEKGIALPENDDKPGHQVGAAVISKPDRLDGYGAEEVATKSEALDEGLNSNVKVNANELSASNLDSELLEAKMETPDPLVVDKKVVDSGHTNDNQSVKQEVTAKSVQVPGEYRSKKWLQEQDGSSYMAQILGSYSEETALNFIMKVGAQKFDVFYLETEHKGKPWYVVFYGIFPAKTHAQDAVKNAPKIIRSQNPWIRRSSEVLASYPK